jgi:hypothetical protein
MVELIIAIMLIMVIAIIYTTLRRVEEIGNERL